MSPDKLDRYRAMRDFEATPEPAGSPAKGEPGGRFVIQEHHATRLHWDLRLEHDGALASWAVPNAMPEVPHENRLAVRTEPHPLEYLDFHGQIPEGSYGAGRMTIWDRGTFTVEEWTDDKKITVVLEGERLTGRYALFHIGPDAKDWMVHRMDEPLDPGREPMPRRLVPMKPVGGELPGGEGWAFEVLWPGARVTIVSEPGRLHVYDETQREVTDVLPEVRPFNRALSSEAAVLDGVLVAFDPEGRPDPERVRRRLAARGDSAARRGVREAPVTLVLTDLLYVGGRFLLAEPYSERRALLDALGLEGAAWRAPAFHEGDGAALLEAVRAQGLPGLVAKRLDSPYRPGAVSEDWIRAGGEEAMLDARAVHARARGAGTDASEVEPSGEGVIEITGSLEERREAGLALRGMLGRLGLESFPCVAGEALQVWIPFDEGADREAVSDFLGAVAKTLDGAVEAGVRAAGRTVTAPYSPGSAGVTWEEVEEGPLSYSEADVAQRLASLGDPLAPVLSTPQKLPQ